MRRERDFPSIKKLREFVPKLKPTRIKHLEEASMIIQNGKAWVSNHWGRSKLIKKVSEANYYISTSAKELDKAKWTSSSAVTCKEYAVRDLRSWFVDPKKFNYHWIISAMDPRAIDRAAYIINSFEMEYMGLKNPSKFHLVEGTNAMLLFQLARRWYRNPLLTYFALSLIRAAIYVDVNKSAKENIEHLLYSDLRFIGCPNEDTNIDHLKYGGIVLKDIMELGFDTVMRNGSKKNLRYCWHLDGDNNAPYWGPSHFGAIYNSVFLENRTPSEEKLNYFRGLKDEYLKQIFDIEFSRREGSETGRIIGISRITKQEEEEDAEKAIF